MKVLLQRVAQAKVEVERRVVGSIGPGVLVFLGVTHKDTPAEAAWLANKVVHLRIFEDDEGKFNRSLLEKKGEVLVISQFTLYADCSQGRRPSFTQAAQPELANTLYEKFMDELRVCGLQVQSGIFGAKMQVSLTNDGPVTLLIER
jgi:D-tyrosyl-tRNA(Tyr) deacylase